MSSAVDKTQRIARLAASPPLHERVALLMDAFEHFYPDSPLAGEATLAYAPGRAEVLGNHTDYNEGYTLSANVTRYLLVLGQPRTDNVVRVASVEQGGNAVQFSLGSTEEVRRGGEYIIPGILYANSGLSVCITSVF